jgi:hypothetical protein
MVRRNLATLVAVCTIVASSAGSAQDVRASHTVPAMPGDFNGDGYADLAIGAPGEDSVDGEPNAGRVVVLYGSLDGVDPQVSQTIAQRTPGMPSIPGGGVRYVRFGWELASGDFDADGYADLVVAAQRHWRTPEGPVDAMWLVPGSPSGLLPETAELMTPRRFGLSMLAVQPDALAAGDLDGDGDADLVAVGKAEDRAALGIAMLAGSPLGLAIEARQLWPGQPYASSYALAVGDVTGDGAAELAVGMPDPVPPATDGSVAVISVGRDPSAAERVETWDATALGRSWPAVDDARDMDALGFAVAIGDFDGDGYGDLAAGAPEADVRGVPCGERRAWRRFPSLTRECDQGAVLVLRGGSGGLTTTESQAIVPGRDGIAIAGRSASMFGARLVAGDLDGDARSDLVVGSPRDTFRVEGPNDHTVRTWSGAVTVLAGSRDGLVASDAGTITQDTPGVPGMAGPMDRFGDALTILRGPGWSAPGDLVVGVPHDRARNPRAGTLFIFEGTPNGIEPTDGVGISQASARVPGGSERGDDFGAAFAP